MLISDNSSELNPKYSLTYDRLADALFRASVHWIKNTSYDDEIFKNYLPEGEDIPADLYLDERLSNNELRDTREELKACASFLAPLSRVDGLIWLNSSLQLRGFGVEITVRSDPDHVFLAQNTSGTKTNKLDLNEYGTRHRSMLRYCDAILTVWGLLSHKTAMSVQLPELTKVFSYGTTSRSNSLTPLRFSDQSTSNSRSTCTICCDRF